MNQRKTRQTLGILSLIGLAYTIYRGLFASPDEAALGSNIRIIYLHVGSVLAAYLAFALTAYFSSAYLIHDRKSFDPADSAEKLSPLRFDHYAGASAEVGSLFCFITLATGMLVAKAAQGWWWRWDDRRLVITLLLWLLFLGYLALRQFTEGPTRARLSAILALMGLPMMVLNHFASILWQRAHPAPIAARPEGAAIDGPIQSVLNISILAFLMLMIWLILSRAALAKDEAVLDQRYGTD